MTVNMCCYVQTVAQNQMMVYVVTDSRSIQDTSAF